MTAKKIRPRVRDSILRALSAGVVPAQGLQFIQVGRAPEIKAMLRSVEAVADGSSVFKLVVGDYGAGKTFFLHLVRQIAFEHKLVTVHADFSPERRLVASGGQARSLYSELISNMATRNRPEGNALSGIIEMFVAQAIKDAEAKGASADRLIEERLSSLQDLVAVGTTTYPLPWFEVQEATLLPVPYFDWPWSIGSPSCYYRRPRRLFRTTSHLEDHPGLPAA